MSDPVKSVKCVRDIRQYPWLCYVLPTDGRKASAVAEKRRALAIQLATYADGDGSRVFPGLKRMATEIGWPHRTLCRRMDELRTIGVLNEKDGLDGVHGTALRSLNIEAVTVFQWVSWLPAGVPDSRGEQECQIRGPEVPDTRAEVPDRKAGVPRMGGTQPPRPTVTQPPTTATSNTAEVVAFSLKRYEATIGTLGWIQKERFDVLLAEHGAPDVHRALAAIVKDGFGEVRTSKWAIALHRLPQKIAELQAAIADADRRAKEQVNIDTNIEYQITENILGWETQWRDDFTMTDDERSLLAQVRSCGRGYDIATARALIKRHSEWRIYKRDEESCTADDFFGAEATP